MTTPVIAEITTYEKYKVGAMTTGAAREFWYGIRGLSGASAVTSTSKPIYYLLNPFNQDMVVMNALAVVTTKVTADGDIDVGLGDNAAGTGTIGAEIIDSLIANTAGVLECTIAQAVAGTGAKCIWRKAGTSSDSYLIFVQNADQNEAAMRWHLFLKLMPHEDMIGGEGTQAAVTGI